MAPALAEMGPEKVEILADELSARIGGCNLAFRELEADLNEKGDWTAARLEPLADRLKLLVTRRGDLQLYRDAITDEQRATVDALASPKGEFRPWRPTLPRPAAGQRVRPSRARKLSARPS